jgi:hypothetical protein
MVETPTVDAGSLGKIAAGTGAAGVVTELTVGLDRAGQAAGGVLRGIFGGLPWKMTPGEIVDAVAGGLGEAAGQAGLVVGELVVHGVA